MSLSMLAGVMLALFVAVWLWQNPSLIRGRLRPQEIARFLAQIERLPFPADERPELLQRLRTWMENDDGKPFYMLNLMRYYSDLRRLPGAPEFQGTPQQSNAHYEAVTRSMLLKLGGIPCMRGRLKARTSWSTTPPSMAGVACSWSGIRAGGRS